MKSDEFSELENFENDVEQQSARSFPENAHKIESSLGLGELDEKLIASVEAPAKVPSLEKEL